MLILSPSNPSIPALSVACLAYPPEDSHKIFIHNEANIQCVLDETLVVVALA